MSKSLPFSRPALALALLLLVLGVVLAPSGPRAATPLGHAVTIAGDSDVEVTRFPADGRYLALWISPGYGQQPEHEAFAAELAEAGIEVWMADLVDAFFMVRDRNAMLKINPEAVAELALAAHAETAKAIVLMATASAAIPVLRGARAWQTGGGPSGAMIGAVLLSPELNRAVPALGDEPEALPIVAATNIPLLIVQTGLLTSARRLPELLSALESGGSPVYTRLVRDVSVLFEKDARSAEAAAAIAALPRQIAATLPVLAAAPFPAKPAPLPGEAITERPALDADLKPMRGTPPAPSIQLTDIRGAEQRIDDYTGKVTVVNFWATWCPPCVEEIPALNRLQAAMAGEPFRLISVSSGEQPEVVESFLARVPVEFPILMDTTSEVTGAWRVIALPSTFVVGPDGRIRCGTNGAIHWDDPEVIRELKDLIDEPKH